METLMWQRAASLAARAHVHQRRKDGQTPYVAHPFRVAMTVRDVFGCADETALTIAVLHDTIEDTTVDYDDILSQYGAAVADGVAALTKNKMLREDVRETEYDRRLGAADWRARLVKLADTFDNLSDLANFDEGSRAAQLERLRSRCGRAIKLAEPDAGEHEALRRGIDAVRSLLEKCSKA
jgi:(p)ppGpp synthase/HD superfamily hydrolase